MSSVKRLGKVATTPLWKRFRWRIEAVSGQKFDPQLADLRRELDELRHEVRAVRDRADALQGDLRWHDDEIRRLAAHVSATDSRVASLERPSGGARPSSELEEVRAEHARLRARTAVVAQYEERLSRVEEALSQRRADD